MAFNPQEATPSQIRDYSLGTTYEGPPSDLESNDNWERVNIEDHTGEEILENMANFLEYQLLSKAGHEEQRKQLVDEKRPEEFKTIPVYRNRNNRMSGDVYLTTSFSNLLHEEPNLFHANILYNGYPDSQRTEISYQNNKTIHDLNKRTDSEPLPQLEKLENDYILPHENGASVADARVRGSLWLGEIKLGLNFDEEKWEETIRRLDEDVTGAAQTLENEMVQLP